MGETSKLGMICINIVIMLNINVIYQYEDQYWVYKINLKNCDILCF